MGRFSYSEWDGTQNFGSLDADELMDKISRDLLSHGNLSDILRRMQRFGMQNSQGMRMPGIEQLREQLRRMKKRQLEKYNLGSAVDEIRKKLDDIVRKESDEVDRRLSGSHPKTGDSHEALSQDMQNRLLKKMRDMAARNREQLDKLPPDPGGKIKELSRYDFLNDEARQEFQELLDSLKKHAMESYGRDLVQNMKNMDPAAMKNMRQMLKALNKMMEAKLRGEEPDFDKFMSQFGQYFGPNPPENFDELMENLQQQIAQAQSLMESLSPEDRQELEDLLQSMLDEDTQRELAKMAANMGALYPDMPSGHEYPFSGQETVSYNEAMKLMELMQKMDSLEGQLNQPADQIDDELLKELLGEDAAADLERIREITKALEEAGYIQLKNRRWELTPRGLRKIGEKALHDIFKNLNKDRIGSHNLNKKGLVGEREGETRKYEPGDDFDIDFQKTIMNAIQREPSLPPLKLKVDDFEVFKREGLTRTATAIVRDLSLSMFLNGYFEAAKRTAFALEALIRGQFPQDKLHIVGFSLYAREIKAKDLLTINFDRFQQGTNLQHALSLASKLLLKERCQNSQIILITDGEPTSHLEGKQAFFQHPPTVRTLQLTLKEVRNCTQRGIIINTFMFDDYHFMTNFVEYMTALNKGRIFFANSENLGKYVLVDYVTGKKKVI